MEAVAEIERQRLLMFVPLLFARPDGSRRAKREALEMNAAIRLQAELRAFVFFMWL